MTAAENEAIRMLAEQMRQNQIDTNLRFDKNDAATLKLSEAMTDHMLQHATAAGVQTGRSQVFRMGPKALTIVIGSAAALAALFGAITDIVVQLVSTGKP